MLPHSLFDKIRRIEIVTSRLVTDVFAGQYHSVFKGRGIEFDEVREYQPGDDTRLIDWNVTARTGIPHIKKYVEERELTVMLMVDVSRSCHFGTVRDVKNRMAAEIAAVLAFSAIRNNDKIGLLFFSDTVEKYIPPRKGRGHVLRLIREVLSYEPQGRGSRAETALEFLNKVLSRRAVCFLISDFLGPADAEGIRKVLTVTNRRHDLIAVTLNDPREVDLPDCGLLELEDAEAGIRRVVDTSDRKARESYAARARERLALRARTFRAVGMDHIDAWTDRSFSDELVRFFAMRRRRMR
ncbi:MAG: DUF58 domain-containing protein [Elusimicrobia bacterium]|nr:DUF58 domain-containing protein [Elusimicrobiota bacterium]